MTFSPEYLADRIRTAEHEEVRNSEETFVAGLSDILSVKAMRKGVAVDLDTHRHRFEQVLEIIGANEKTAGSLSQLALRGAMLDRSTSRTNLGGDWLEAYVAEYGVATTLERMQSLDWVSSDRQIVQPSEEFSHSSIVMGNDTFATVLSVQAGNYPVAISEYGHLDILAPALSEKNETSRDRLRIFTEFLGEDEMQVQLPRIKYQIALGKTAASGIEYAWDRYLYSDGTFTKKVEESE